MAAFFQFRVAAAIKAAMPDPSFNLPLIVFLDRASLRTDIELRRPAHPHRWIEHQRTTPDEVAGRLAGAAVAVTNKAPITRATLAACPGLRLVAVAATGVDVVDLAAAAEHGVRVMNVPGYAAESVAEHVFALALALRRAIIPHRQEVLDGGWTRAPGFCLLAAPIQDLAGSTLGIVGAGAIGGRAAELGRAFGMQVLLAERPGAAPRDGRVAFDEVLQRADILSLHCPSTDETRGLIGAEALARMKPGAILVNTARGDLVDEAALLAALEAGRIGGAGLDVAAHEPPPAGSTILKLAARPDVIVTPHVAWASAQASRLLLDRLTANIEAFLGEREG
jgi:glycerate dehydrogenase